MTKLIILFYETEEQGRAVARPWRERRLPRAPVYRERKNSQIFIFDNLKIQKLTLKVKR